PSGCEATLLVDRGALARWPSLCTSLARTFLVAACSRHHSALPMASETSVPSYAATAPHRTSPAARLAVAAFACPNVAVALLVRVVHRGPYAPGWDFVGAA